MTHSSHPPSHHEHHHHPHEHPPKEVTVLIGTVEKRLRVGPYTVAELKHLGGIPATDILEIVKHGDIKPLPNDGTVEICEDTKFLACPVAGRSS